MPKKKAAPAPEPVELTKAQEYYIQGNRGALTPVQIAADIDAPVSTVQAYINSLDVAKGESHFSQMLHKSNASGQKIQGVVAMTGEASEAADDRTSEGMITRAEVNRAAAAGNYEEAARLQKLMNEQVNDRREKVRAANSDRWHFIRKG